MPSLNHFIAGGTSCILNHGTTKSGKTCTMFGANDSIGLLRQSGEYILNSAAHSNILASAFEIIGTECFDLAKNRTRLNGNNASTITVSSGEDLKTFVEQNQQIKTRNHHGHICL